MIILCHYGDICDMIKTRGDSMLRINNETRDRILESARRQFIEYGYHESSIESIAKESECNKRTVLRYFSSKSLLLLTLVNEMFTDFYRDIQIGIRESDNAYDDLGLFMSNMIRSCKDHSNLMYFMGTQANIDKKLVQYKEEHMKFSNNLCKISMAIGDIIRRGIEDSSIECEEKASIISNGMGNLFLTSAELIATNSHNIEMPKNYYPWEVLAVTANQMVRSFRRR